MAATIITRDAQGRHGSSTTVSDSILHPFVVTTPATRINAPGLSSIHTCGFMPHDERRLAPARAAIHAMNITAANSAGIDRYKNVLRPEFRGRHIFDAESFIFLE